MIDKNIMKEFEGEGLLVAKNIVAINKVKLFCVAKCYFQDLKPVIEIPVAFFDEEMAKKAQDYLNKHDPVPLSSGWIEIIPTTISKMEK